MEGRVTKRIVSLLVLVMTTACGGGGNEGPQSEGSDVPEREGTILTRYAEVSLTTDLGVLTDNERKMIPILIEACRAMDDAFWMQAYGDKEALLSRIDDPELRRFAEINYGPWDRLRGDEPFLPGVGPKPKGANFYPPDMTVEEFETAAAIEPALESAYTVVRREDGDLAAIPYYEAYREPFERAATKLEEAAEFADDPGLKRYLDLRARALRSGEYRESDMAWMDMKNNVIDVVIGPIENYEDKLFGIRTAAEGYVLVKDRVWSQRLARFAELLPDLQRGLPVPDAYKAETPGTDSDLNAYDAVFYAGDCNAGSKTIAINLPNDEQVQLEKGTRRLQLKNAMRAKYDTILVPIADRIIDPEQRRHVTFDAFFSNVMFHEVAHGLGIKNTLNGSGTVREALKDLHGSLEEGKADVLGLHMIARLHELGEWTDSDLMDNYVTYLAGIFRSVRFGASSAHGRANLFQFLFYRDAGAFTYDEATGRFRVDPERMRAANDALAEKILRLQGDGDYEGVKAFVPVGGVTDPLLRATLDSLSADDIPTDVVFRQGWEVLQENTASAR
jgi:hypothetical protein